MSNIRIAIGTLIVAALSLATTAVESSPVHAKDHRVHSFLSRGTYAQRTNEINRVLSPGKAAGAYAYQPRDMRLSPAEAGRFSNIYHSLSQGRQDYPNPNRVPLNATTEPF